MIIQTTRGPMDEADLVKRAGTIDNEHERTTWIEYWHEGVLVHRSAHVTLKQWPEGWGAVAAPFGS